MGRIAAEGIIGLVSSAAKFWTFTAVVLGTYFFVVWKALANPKLVFFPFFVMLIFVAGTRQFRCPRCKNPIMKRPTTKNRLGYEWRIPTSRNCPNCGAIS